MRLSGSGRMWAGVALRAAVPSALGLVLLTGAFFLFILPQFERGLLARKHEMIRALVQTVHAVFARLDERQRSGEITLAAAQARARGVVESLRYGTDGREYFWLQGADGRVLYHPHRRDMEGIDLATFGDRPDAQVLRRLSRAAREPGGGFVEYEWQRHDDASRVAPKLSYVALYEPWGWIVGTGVYLDDVAAETALLTRRVTAVALLTLLCVALLSGFVTWQHAAAELRRRRALEALRVTEENYRTIFDSATDGMVIHDAATGAVVDANRKYLADTGYTLDELRRLPFSIVACGVGDCTPQRAAALSAAAAAGHPQRVEWEALTRDGRPIKVEISLKGINVGTRRCVLATGHDLTERYRAEEERRHLQEQLHQSQKLEAIGQLASGVAHDFNNLLTVILGATDQLRGLAASDPAAGSALDAIERAVGQATGVTRALLTFSHRVPAEKRPLDLAALVQQSAKLFGRVLSAAIELRVDARSPTPLWVNGDGTQLQQVLMNLIVNARDAMPNGGRLQIGLAPEWPDGAATNGPPPRVRLTVADTGCGMAPDVQARIFEPFFTTKGRGQGTGLGLAITHAIVRDHGGGIAVQSTPGAGTTSIITLPAVPPARPGGERDDTPATTAPGHGELLLVVDDNHLACELIAAKLRGTGYTVMVAGDGRTACELAEAHAAELRLLVLDLDLPGLSGLECLRRLRGVGSRTPAIIITGNVDVPFEDQLDDETLVLRKPFPMHELTRLVELQVRGGEVHVDPA